MSKFPAIFNLTSLNGNNGFVINGINYNDISGSSVSGAGDVNGDGIADIIIGAPNALRFAGQSYVIFGSKSGFSSPFNLTSLDGNNGFAINGINGGQNGDLIGSSARGAGDINGDGIADIIIGAFGPYNGAGQSYVIFGSKEGFTTPFNLADLNGNNGFVINGIHFDGYSSISVSGAGDVNGDGIDDIIIGAPYANYNIGQTYLVFGSKSGFTSPFNVTNLNGKNGFAINGINDGQNGDLSGSSVSGAGDINSDGIADIIIGAFGAYNGAGRSYVIFGSKSGFSSPLNLVSLNGNNGFATNGINQGDWSGNSVSGVSDINGDGIADIIIGAHNANNGVGQSYVIFGSKSGFSSPFNLISLNGNNGFAVNGINVDDQSGSSVSGAGDVNGDGIDDIIIGAPNADNSAGQSYVVFGSKSGFITPFNLTELNGINGFAINGINNNDWSGIVSGAGDVNSDGIADIIIGAYGANNGAGQSYVVFGSNSGLNDLIGENADDADEGSFVCSEN